MAGFSAKLFNIIGYLDSFDMARIDEFLDQKAIQDYAWIIHDKDESKPHVDIAIRCKDSVKSGYVAKWFQVPENLVGKVKGRYSDILSYLTHANAPGKHQYDDSEVHSNFDWKGERSKGNDQVRLKDIITMIGNGELREYDYAKYIDIHFWTRHKTKLERAFAYKLDSLRSEEREMECIYITGDSGAGKTSLAIQTAKNRGLSFFISGSGKDFMDGYKGQECVILDDLRASAMKVSDLLKMLDPNYRSSVTSRYANKVLQCELIIITTVQPIDTFFKNVFAEDVECSIQLKRRVKYHVTMNSEVYHVRKWDSKAMRYHKKRTYPNNVLDGFGIESETPEQVDESISRSFGHAPDVKPVGDCGYRLPARNQNMNVYA